jgi:hypothetical protein
VRVNKLILPNRLAEQIDLAIILGGILLASTKPSIHAANDDQQERKAKEDEPRTYSRFNDLSVALALAITGLVVVYLPEMLNKSLDWMVEGRILGVAIGITGACFALFAAAKLTGQNGLSDWGGATLTGAAAVGLIIALHKYHLSPWVTIILITLTVLLVFVGIFALVSGFASFFEKPTAKTGHAGTAPSTNGNLIASDEAEIGKELSGYERITLIVALVSGIATVAAAVEPLVHLWVPPG